MNFVSSSNESEQCQVIQLVYYIYFSGGLRLNLILTLGLYLPDPTPRIGLMLKITTKSFENAVSLL